MTEQPAEPTPVTKSEAEEFSEIRHKAYRLAVSLVTARHDPKMVAFVIQDAVDSETPATSIDDLIRVLRIYGQALGYLSGYIDIAVTISDGLTSDGSFDEAFRRGLNYKALGEV